jgi:DNA-binding winged helix-turn-helix (wHTH) protein
MTESYPLYQFGDFTLDPEQLSLMCNGASIHVASTAFQILSLLVRNSGRIVTKDLILKEVWQDRFVEESNIT